MTIVADFPRPTVAGVTFPSPSTRTLHARRACFFYVQAVEGRNANAKLFAVAGVAAFEWIDGIVVANADNLLDVMREPCRRSFRQADRSSGAMSNSCLRLM